MTRARHPALVPLDEASSLAKRSGVAGASLLLLSKAGVEVAPTWLLEAGAFRDAVAKVSSDAEPKAVLKKKKAERSEAAAKARDALLHLVFPEPLSLALRALAEDLLAAGSGVTLRRALTVGFDDDLELSRETARFVVHVDEVEPAVRALWAETYLESTLLAAVGEGHREFSTAVLLSPGDLRQGTIVEREAAPFLRVWTAGGRVVSASEIRAAATRGAHELAVSTAMSRSVAVQWIDDALRAFGACFDEDLAKERRLAVSTPRGVSVSLAELTEACREAFPQGVSARLPGGGPAPRALASGLASSVGALSHRRRLAALEREVEETKLLARARRDADVELDLSILPDDSLVPSLREPLAMMHLLASLHGRLVAEALLAAGRLTDALAPHLKGRSDDLVLSLASSSLWASPARALAEVAAAAREDPASRESLDRGGPPSGLSERLFARFLREHGDLPRDTLELQRGSLGESPDLALAMLRALVAADRPPAVVREIALGPLGRLARPVVEALRGQATLAFSLLAETSRLLFGVLATLREVVREASARLSRMDLDVPREGAFATTLDELLPALKTGDPRLGEVIAWRLAEPPQPVRVRAREVVGVAPGVGTGPLRVVRDPRTAAEVRSGDVLWLDASAPLWAPLVGVASAVVLPGGTGLSSLAFVARALGVPAVTSSPLVPSQEGALVRVDGSRGRLDPA